MLSPPGRTCAQCATHPPLLGRLGPARRRQQRSSCADPQRWFQREGPQQKGKHRLQRPAPCRSAFPVCDATAYNGPPSGNRTDSHTAPPARNAGTRQCTRRYLEQVRAHAGRSHAVLDERILAGLIEHLVGNVKYGAQEHIPGTGARRRDHVRPPRGPYRGHRETKTARAGKRAGGRRGAAQQTSCPRGRGACIPKPTPAPTPASQPREGACRTRSRAPAGSLFAATARGRPATPSETRQSG